MFSVKNTKTDCMWGNLCYNGENNKIWRGVEPYGKILYQLRLPH